MRGPTLPLALIFCRLNPTTPSHAMLLFFVSFVSVAVALGLKQVSVVRRPTFPTLFRMSANEFGREPQKVTSDNSVANKSSEEEDSAEEQQVRKQEISDEMRRRLIREVQAQGGDANVSAGNPILVISGIIALLVIVGGKGFFY